MKFLKGLTMKQKVIKEKNKDIIVAQTDDYIQIEYLYRNGSWAEDVVYKYDKRYKEYLKKFNLKGLF